MKRLGLGILLLAVPACDTGGPNEPVGTTVTLTLMNPASTDRPESLRLAVVWRTGGPSEAPWIATFDHGLSDTEDSLSVPVDLPKGVALDELPDPVTVMLECEGWESTRSWPGVRPLWVVYEDLNRNQHLDGVSSDRVWGITDFSRNHLVAFENLDQVLSQMTLEGSECVRQATGGGFSPFVSGYGSQSFYVASIRTSEFPLFLNPSNAPSVLLSCGLSHFGSRTPVQELTQLAVAPTVAFDGCADAATCTRVSYESDWQGATQPVNILGFYRSSRCVRSGKLEVLWIREERSDCSDCTCVPHVRDRGWVVSGDATPLGWPCGDSVNTCATTSDQVELIPNECLEL